MNIPNTENVVKTLKSIFIDKDLKSFKENYANLTIEERMYFILNQLDNITFCGAIPHTEDTKEYLLDCVSFSIGNNLRNGKPIPYIDELSEDVKELNTKINSMEDDLTEHYKNLTKEHIENNFFKEFEEIKNSNTSTNKFISYFE